MSNTLPVPTDDGGWSSNAVGRGRIGLGGERWIVGYASRRFAGGGCGAPFGRGRGREPRGRRAGARGGTIGPTIVVSISGSGSVPVGVSFGSTGELRRRGAALFGVAWATSGDTTTVGGI